MSTARLSFYPKQPLGAETLFGALSPLEEQVEDLAINFTLEGDKVSAVQIYHPDHDRLHALQPEVRHLFDQLEIAGRYEIEATEDEDWVAKVQAGLHPVYAGKFVIHGEHDRAAIPRHFHAIEVEAGQAFGTGHHESTRGCLLALSRLARFIKPGRVLDFGCGSGVLGIAAYRLFKCPVRFIDIDATAVEVTRKNARLNGVPYRGRTAVSSDPSGAGQAFLCEDFDLVFANILAAPLVKMAPKIAASVAPGGYLVLAGILKTQGTWVEKAYRAQGLVPYQRQVDGDWISLTLRAR